MHRTRRWLNAGELRVAEAFGTLDDGWTVCVQPRLGMDVPDFVALHDRFGVCAIEVKDWAFGQSRNVNGVVEYRRSGVWTPIAQHPRLARTGFHERPAPILRVASTR